MMHPVNARRTVKPLMENNNRIMLKIKTEGYRRNCIPKYRKLISFHNAIGPGEIDGINILMAQQVINRECPVRMCNFARLQIARDFK